MSIDITALAIKVESVGIREASSALGGLSTSAANTEKRIMALAASTSKLQSVNVAATNAMNSYMAKLQQQAALMQSLNVSSVGAATSTAALASAMALLAASLNALNMRTRDAEQSQRRHNESMREAHGLARGLSGSLGALWLTYGNFLGMAVGVGIGASLKAIVTIGKDVEHTLEGIRVRGQETVVNIDKMRESLMELGKGVYGPQQVANAFETLILAGLNAEQALASVSAALNLATVGGTSIEKSAQTLVSVGSAIGFVAEGYSRIGDVISKTAALSMSSVETLSEAFKSSSSVAKLYGVSLEDIATSLGILSNLGIQGSAAGTALKNMYKELASEADKVQNTFKKMGIEFSTLKNADGNFKPLLTVVKELDGALSKLSPQEEKLAIARLSNERGMRLMVQALDLYRTKLSDGSNALQKFRDDAEDSFGFAAKGAVMMSLTAKSQIDSMMNTLKTVFVATFKSVEPEIVLFTHNMKSAFNSPQFKTAVLSIANAFASMALAIAENLPLITKMISLLIAMKAAAAIGAMLQGLAAGIAAFSIAMRAAAAGALTLTLAMPALAAILVVAAGAWTAYQLAKGEAIAEKSVAVAAAYSKSVIDGMINEAEQLTKTTALIKNKMSAQEAINKVERDTLQQQMELNDQKAVQAARAETEKYRIASNATKYAEGLRVVEALELRAINNKKLYAAASEALTKAAKANAEAVSAQAKDKGIRPEATASLGGDLSKAQINDAYTAAIIKQDALIRSAKKEMRAFEDQQFLAFKSGEIGKLEFLENISKKQIDVFNKAQSAVQEKLKLAQSRGDKSDTQKYMSEIEQAEQDSNAFKVSNAKEAEVQIAKYVEDYTKFRIKKLEEEGSFASAAAMQFSLDHSVAFKEAKADAEKYGDVYPILVQRAEAFTELQRESIKQGLNKEAVAEFNVLSEATRNALKGIQTATEGLGIGAMLDAATEASARLTANMGNLRSKLGDITDPKDINEAQAQLTNLAETQRKLWVGVGESISKSLGSAFGNAGKAAGELLMVAINAGNVETKLAADKKRALYEVSQMQDGYTNTTILAAKVQIDFAAKEKSARIKGYGDMASAAKGFFKEGSTGYKIMETAEKAFRAIELFGIAKSLALTVSSEAAKNVAKIPGVIMSFMSMMGPWGAAAAAVAIAAVLGGGGGGSSITPMSAEQRQKEAGTGSVFGDKDAKSESIANSLDIMERNSGLGLVHSDGMLKSLRSIEASMVGFSNLIIRGGVSTSNIKDSQGSAQNFFMKENDNALARVFAGPLGSITNKFMGKVLGSIFGGATTVLDTGVMAQATPLGTVNTSGLQAQQYSETKKEGGWFHSDKYSDNPQALSAEINQQFSLIVSGLGKGVNAAADALGIGGDTFTNKLNSFVVNLGKISLKDLSSEEIQEQFAAIFSKLGDDMAKFGIAGLEKFQNIGEGYFETLARVANDLVQVKDVFAVMGQSFNLTGMAAIEVSESLILAAGGLEKLTGDTKYFVDNFLTESERMAPITASVNKRLAELGQSELTTVELYKNKVLALDLANAADQNLYAALIALAPAFQQTADYANGAKDATDIANKRRELEIRLMEAQGRVAEALNARRSDELAALYKLDPALSAIQQRIYNATDAADAQAKAKTNLEQAYQRESTALQSVVDKFKAFSESLKKFKESLLVGELSTLSPEQKYFQSKAKFESTSALAATGNEVAIGELQGVSQIFLDASRGYNASTEAYAQDFNSVQRGLASGAKAADRQVSIAQSQLTVMQAQYSTLLNINLGVLSFKDALSQYVTARSGAAAAGVVGPQGSANIGMADVEAYGRSYGEDAYYFNEYNGYASKAANIANLASTLGGSVADMWKRTTGHTEDYWKEAQRRFDAGLHPTVSSMSSYDVDGSHYNGLNEVPWDGYVAEMHKGERIQTANAANASDKNSAELVRLTKELLEKISYMEEHAEASNNQRGAIAEMTTEQMETLIKRIEEVKRAVKTA